jgi:hypothetical protein
MLSLFYLYIHRMPSDTVFRSLSVPIGIVPSEVNSVEDRIQSRSMPISAVKSMQRGDLHVP